MSSKVRIKRPAAVNQEWRSRASGGGAASPSWADSSWDSRPSREVAPAREVADAAEAPRPAYDFGTIPLREATPRRELAHAAHGAGQPLAVPLRRTMETAYGADFSNVTIHEAPQVADIGARALTRGDQIHFAPGKYRPHSGEGKWILAHELAHVMQQRRGEVRVSAGSPLTDSPAHEHAASAMATRALAGAPAKGAGSQRASAATTAAVIQPFWELQPDGKITWKDGSPPKTHVPTTVTKTHKGNTFPVHAAPEVWDAQKGGFEQKKLEEEAAAQKRDPASALSRGARDDEVARRPTRIRPHRELSAAERRGLSHVPKELTREDHDLAALTNKHGVRKAHLTEEGLEAPGKKPIYASEQLNSASRRKGEGNRISFKGPLRSGEPDRSNVYGGENLTAPPAEIRLKARKLERARLRGKPDAQHVALHPPEQIQHEIRATEARHLSRDPKEAERVRAERVKWAAKDREWHAEVNFLDAAENRHYIPDRFLSSPDRPEIHDSDSESDSETEDLRAPSSDRGGRGGRRGRGRDGAYRGGAPLPASSSPVVPSAARVTPIERRSDEESDEKSARSTTTSKAPPSKPPSLGPRPDYGKGPTLRGGYSRGGPPLPLYPPAFGSLSTSTVPTIHLASASAIAEDSDDDAELEEALRRSTLETSGRGGLGSPDDGRGGVSRGRPPRRGQSGRGEPSSSTTHYRKAELSSDEEAEESEFHARRGRNEEFDPYLEEALRRSVQDTGGADTGGFGEMERKERRDVSPPPRRGPSLKLTAPPSAKLTAPPTLVAKPKPTGTPLSLPPRPSSPKATKPPSRSAERPPSPVRTTPPSTIITVSNPVPGEGDGKKKKKRRGGRKK